MCVDKVKSEAGQCWLMSVFQMNLGSLLPLHTEVLMSSLK